MKNKKGLVSLFALIIMLTGCGSENETSFNISASVPFDNDVVDIKEPQVSISNERNSIISQYNNVSVQSGNVDIDYNENITSSSQQENMDVSVQDGDANVNIIGDDVINNGVINQSTVNVENQNINIYVDKVLTDLTDNDGNVVVPFVSNTEIYVPLSSLSEVLGTRVEWDRTNKSVYVGENPKDSNIMLDIVPGYDPQNFKEYSFLKSGGTEYFTMASKKYTDGAVFSLPYSNDTSSVSFNLEGKFTKLKFKLGHLDGSNMNSVKLLIKLDGILEKEI